MSIKGLLPVSGEIQRFIDDISGGAIEPLYASGFRSNVSAAVNGDDIWTGTATTIPIPPSAGQQMQVVSSSANDTSAGTGVKTIDMHYIDANGDEKEEHITMNGTTPVVTTATDIRFVQDIHALTVGTNLAAVGTISISQQGAPTTIYSSITPGMNKALNSSRMVPAGKTLIIRSFNASGGNATKVESSDIRLRATSHHGTILPVSPNPVFILKDNFLSFNTATHRQYTETPIIIPSLAVIKCTSFAAVAGSSVQASWFGILVPNPI